MIIVCKKDTKKLVKGLRYEVMNLWNDGSNQRWLEGKVELKGLGRYVINNFTDIDGKPLPKINIITPYKRWDAIKFEDLKKGDILVCITDQYTTLAKDQFYQIENLTEKNTMVGSWNRIERTIKFVGIKRTLKFSSWRFRKLSTEEVREMSLSNLFGEKSSQVITSQIERKIDLVADKDKLLLQMISAAIVDPNRHGLSILEWTIRKTGNKYGLKQSDFNTILETPLKDLLKKFDF
jgi:hypothetical protein